LKPDGGDVKISPARAYGNMLLQNFFLFPNIFSDQHASGLQAHNHANLKPNPMVANLSRWKGSKWHLVKECINVYRCIQPRRRGKGNWIW